MSSIIAEMLGCQLSFGIDLGGGSSDGIMLSAVVQLTFVNNPNASLQSCMSVDENSN